MASLRQQIATTTLTLTKFRDLMKRMQENRPHDDLTIVKKAYDYSLKYHDGQTRASGEAYIAHPLAVAAILADLEMDKETIAAALLHDVVEDTVVTSEEVAEKFGDEIATLVDGVTKLTRIPYQSKEDAQVENLRKMFLAMAKDIVYTHHEKWDGSGYPQGLRGAEIPIPGRVMALVDVYDALLARRVYRQPMPHAEAVAIIRSGSGTHFDPAVVEAFMAIAGVLEQQSGEGA